MVADPFAADNLVPSFAEAAGQQVNLKVERFGGECSDEEIQRLVEKAHAHQSDLLAGAGGGKTLDTAKAVAHHLRVPAAMIPTIASTDAPCSALSVIYTAQGQVDRYQA
jgi:glycerol dehydrogenase